MKNPLSGIEISKENLIFNFRKLKKVAKKGTKFSVAVKGNAYGHGLKEVVQILDSEVDYFQIDSIEELRILRKISKKKAFLFGYVQKSDLLEAIKLGSILAPFTLEQIRNLGTITQKYKIKQEIHIPIDALLGREGFTLENLTILFEELKKYKYIKVVGIYAHFANIEDIRPDESFGRANNFTHAQKQIKKYEEALKIAKQFGFKKLQTSISATSGLLVYEKSKGINSIIRLGIGIYGLWPSEHIKYLWKNKLELKPVLSWKTKIAQIKELPAGRTIGYGLTYTTYEPKKIAIIPQGYADGYDRNFSNNGEVLIRGTKCKILGRVMMNMFVVDITSLKEVQVEDEVVLLGKQGESEISAENLAQKIDTINYEIVTRINPLLPRVVK
jgi:alanine racemase